MSHLHILNLDTIGGVEELFIHYLTTCKRLTSIPQHILVTGKKPHPFFQSDLKSADSIHLEKYVLGIKAPSFIRSMKRRQAIHKAGPCVTILWNRLERETHSYPTIYYEHGASWIQQQQDAWAKKLSQCERILANSFAAKRLLQLKWGITKDIVVIENPLKPTVTPKEAPKRAKGTLHLGYIGRLIPLKGVSLILHAVKALGNKDIRLTIAGDGPERESLQKEALKLNIQVHFTGVIRDVAAFYDSIDLLIVPSIREPLGLVAQEAALRACPVIGAAVDGLVEVVQDQKTGITISPTLPVTEYAQLGGKISGLPDLVYNPKSDKLEAPQLVDPQLLANQIQCLANDPLLYESMSAAALSFAKRRPNIVQYTENVLKSIDFDGRLQLHS